MIIIIHVLCEFIHLLPLKLAKMLLMGSQYTCGSNSKLVQVCVAMATVGALVGGAAVVGDVLQPSQQSRVVVGTHPLGRHLLLQGHAALPGRGFSGPDHTVDLLETVRGAAADVVVNLVSGGCWCGGRAGLVW